MPNRFRVFLSVLITLLVPALLLLGSIRLLMTDAYLVIEYNKPDFPPDPFGLTLQDRLTYGPIAVQYLLNGEPEQYLNQRPALDGSVLFDEKELEHMRDVKVVVRGAMFALALIGVVFAAACVLLLRDADRRRGRTLLRRGLFSGGLLLLSIFGVLLVLVLIDWNRFFDSFHDIFFAPGSWQFRYDESLIRLFPIRFWQDSALTVGGISALSALAIMVMCWVWSRRDR